MFLLPLPVDPQKWTTVQVQSWLQLTSKQFKLAAVPEMDILFPEDGAALLSLTEEEFVKRLPQVSCFIIIFPKNDVRVE